MSKIVLDDVTSLDAVSVLNSNFDKIEAELNDKVLYKNPPDGEPNALLKDLDINGKRLYNLPAPQASSEPVRKADLDAAVLGDYVVNSGVTSFNTRGGAVTLTNTDVFGALGYVPLITAVTGFRAGADSPRTGTVTLLGTDIATSLGYTPAPLASPTFSGTPTAPTATPGDNTTKVATTAFVTNAVTTATTGVITFNGRSGAVVPGSSDYTVAQISGAAPLASPVFTGSPTAPTQLSSDNSTKLATTAYVKSLVSGAGVSSFNTRTGAVSLSSADIINTLCADNTTKDFIWNTDIAGHANAGDSSSMYIQRKATYSGGTAGKVNSALYIQSYTPTNNSSYEWGLTSELFSYSANVGGGGSGAIPQNVAINWTAWKKAGNAPLWGGNFVVYDDIPGTYNSVTHGPLIGIELNVGMEGTDAGESTIGLHLAPQTTKGASTALMWTGILVDGGGTVNWRTGITLAGGYDFGIYDRGTHAVAIDLSGGTNTSGSAIRIKEGDAIAFENTGNIKMKYRNFSGNQYLEFYNGSTRRGFINLGSGADVDLASGGGGATGVTSFNGLTGPVTYGSSDITGALGYTPASLSGTNTFTGSYNQFNNIVYATGGLNIGSSALTSNSSGNVTFSATAGATALPANVAFFHRIVVDGTTYKIPVYNA